jgi:hypothetical protein
LVGEEWKENEKGWSRDMGRRQIFVLKFTRFGGEVDGIERPKLNPNRQDGPAKPKEERTNNKFTRCISLLNWNILTTIL